MKRGVGKVFIVGGGPGDPGLITKWGSEILKNADAVVVDALVNPALLPHRGNCEIYFAGKRGPSARTNSPQPSQSQINSLLIRLARQGKRVVRLKGGDPFVFGRGSEESEALERARIPYEIVPGVTSAVAAPAYAGISITDRRWSSQVTVMTGQSGHQEYPSNIGIDWDKLSPTGTLIVLMGVATWASTQKRLLSRRWRGNLPVAAIENGTLGNQRVIHTTLLKSQIDFTRKKIKAPAVIVIGEVARRPRLPLWRDREKPLLGRRIVVARPEGQNDEIAFRLREKGAEVIIAPVLRIRSLYGAAVPPRPFDWVIFLSANAVRSFLELTNHQIGLLRSSKLCAVGPKTASAIENFNLKVAKIPRKFNANGVLKALGKVRDRRILIPRAAGAPDELVSALRRRGAKVTELPVYKAEWQPLAKEVKDRILRGIDGLAVTSSDINQSFLMNFRTEELRLIDSFTTFSIGPKTTSMLKLFQTHRSIQAKKATIESLVQSIVEFYSKKRRSK